MKNPNSFLVIINRNDIPPRKFKGSKMQRKMKDALTKKKSRV